MRPTDVPDQGLLCDLLWSDPDKDVQGWGENDRGVSFTFGAEVVAKFLHKHDLDLICRAHQVGWQPPSGLEQGWQPVLAELTASTLVQVVEDGYEFFAKRQLVTLFSAPNYCGEFDNAGAMMSVDETLMCSFQVGVGPGAGRPRDLWLDPLSLTSFSPLDPQARRQEQGEIRAVQWPEPWRPAHHPTPQLRQSQERASVYPPSAPDGGLYRNHVATGGSCWPPRPTHHGEHGGLVYFSLFFYESIAASSPPGLFPLVPTAAAGRILGLRLQLRAKQGQIGDLQPCLASGLAAGSWGNPSGLLNKGQSWILAIACLPCPKHWAWQPFRPEPLGRLAGLRAPARKTPATCPGPQGLLEFPSQGQRVQGKQAVCASHRGSQWCAQDLREGQVMIGRRWISRGRSPTMISFFLREVGLEKAVLQFWPQNWIKR